VFQRFFRAASPTVAQELENLSFGTPVCFIVKSSPLLSGWSISTLISKIYFE
jgi:hypothetical protein